MLYRLSTALVFCFFKLFFAIEVKGKQVFPVHRPFILASNHLSNLDPPVLASCCPYKVSFLAKEELFRNKLFALYLKDVGAIPLKRYRADIKIMRLTLDILKKKPLLIFPQGTRDASFNEANAGVGFLYKKAKAPIIAAKIQGTDLILPKGANFFRKGKIKVIFDRVNNIKESDTYSDITLKVMNKIRSL
jgi:1-acyl-sn-glycerol-3-phosphate acyltransferase